MSVENDPKPIGSTLGLSILEKLAPLARKINCLDLNRIADISVQYIPELIGMKLASFYILNDENNILYLKKYNHPYPLNRIVSLNQDPPSPMTVAVKCKQIIKIDNFDNFKKPNIRKSQRSFSDNYKTTSCVIAPLISHDRVVGVLNMADPIEGNVIDSEKTAIIDLISQLLGASIGNIKKFQKIQLQAATDGMTGFANNKTFYDSLERELIRAARYKEKLSVLMIDVDNLKQINDTFGHRAGDEALEKISRHIKKYIRQTDIPARYGGDEFAVILTNSGIKNAKKAAQRMVDNIHKSPLKWKEHKINLSISVGICLYDNNSSAKELICNADKALYEAKKEGKNKVAVFEL